MTQAHTSTPHTTPKRPWYREPYVWMIISLPLTAVIAGFYTLHLALESDDGLVADDYYKQGLEINQSIERRKEAARLGLSADVQRSGEMLRVWFKGPQDALPESLELALHHHTRDIDHTVTLTAVNAADPSASDTQTLYQGQLSGALTAGNWEAQISTEVWRVSGKMAAAGTQVTLLPHIKLK